MLHRISMFKNSLSRFLKTDISLLLVLCLITQHSFLLKCFGLLLVVLLNLQELKELRLRQLPWFYVVIPLMELLRLLLFSHDFTAGHTALMAVGISYSIAALLVCAVVYENVRRSDPRYVERSIGLYTLLNCLVSVAQYIQICIKEQVINPYNTGHDHPYGISSGDLIHGLTGEVHIVNAFICVFLVVYYVSRRKPLLLLAALLPLLLTGSNYATILLLAGVTVYWLCSRNKKQVDLLLLTGTVTVLFYVFVSSENAKYLSDKLAYIILNRPIAGEQYEARADKVKPFSRDLVIADSRILASWVNHNIDQHFIITPDELLHSLDRPVVHHYDFYRTSGKKIAYMQTFDYLRSGWSPFLFGTGMGGFSSKLAFNFSGVMDQSSIGKYLPAYETPLFRSHHKSIYADLKTRHVIMHSESNRPFSTYNQLLGEYGVLGLLSFLVLYIGYFLRRISFRGYGLPLVIVLLMMLHLDYFIESLNVLVFFELLLFINIHRKHESAAA